LSELTKINCMATFEIVMPKLGESIIEATITRWIKKPGDQVAEDEPIVEIATDKVDSEIPSPVSGILSEQLFKEGEVVEIGKIIAVIDMGGTAPSKKLGKIDELATIPAPPREPAPVNQLQPSSEPAKTSRFYSPLIKNIAKQENIDLSELDSIKSSGLEGRLTKQDLLAWLTNRKKNEKAAAPTVISSGDDEIIEMERIRQLIAQHMVRSVQTSPHVTSFVEIDMTRISDWIDKHKKSFLSKENIKLTFTPVIVDAIARTVRDYPQVNVSVDGSRIIMHRNINIGMAVSLPGFNLIVPVIKNADQKSVLGLVRNVTDLAERSRINKLIPDEISGGTISLTNLGSFGTLMGTPIINQPQTAIVAVGAIKKKPVVVETPQGDAIAVRKMMYASLSYDHRVIDGALAGLFLNRLTQYLENFDTSQNL
jgi:2-oxoglutarate dehydrogenase E2 component (dihydrolipoamide succinyltransferase)